MKFFKSGRKVCKTMTDLFTRLQRNEEGSYVVEAVILLGIMIALGMIFSDYLYIFAWDIFEAIFW